MADLNPYKDIGKFKFFKKDEVVFTQNEIGDTMYVVTKGMFGVYIGSFSDEPVRVAEINEGGFFGEMSAIDAWLRSATIICEEAGAAVSVKREDIPALLDCNTDISEKILKTLYERIIPIEKTVREKGNEITDLPKELIEPTPQNPETDLENMMKLAQRIRGLNDILSDCETEASIKLKPNEANSASEGASENKATVTVEAVPLFPEAHGENHNNFNLELTNDNTKCLTVIKFDCPLCGSKFDNHFVLMSKLKREGTDDDMRARFEGFEPIYYSVVTCPDCLFSAEAESFSDAQKRYADNVFEALAPYKAGMSGTHIKTLSNRDTYSVFAGYYLALICAPIVFDKHELITAGLWLKLSRMYEDCKIQDMIMYSIRQALDAYNFVYTKTHISEKQSHQVCFILGALNFKLKDYDTARQLFYTLKSDKGTSPSLKRAVEERLETIREIKKLQE
jgi:hypothetical protein